MTWFRRSMGLVLTICAIWALAGCAAKHGAKASTASAAERESSSYYEHTVRWPGETLSLIAKWYTGDQNNWERIAKENPGINPLGMKRGDRIQIPKGMMTRTESMPRSYAGRSAEKRARSRSAGHDPANGQGDSAEAPEDSGMGEPAGRASDIELFGPKE